MMNGINVLLTNERIYNHTNSLLMSVIRYHVSLAFSSLPPDSSQRLDILLRGEDIYIYTHHCTVEKLRGCGNG